MECFAVTGAHPVSNQLPYNLLWRAIEHGTLPTCRALGLGVLCYSPLQQGILCGKSVRPGTARRPHTCCPGRRPSPALASAPITSKKAAHL